MYKVNWRIPIYTEHRVQEIMTRRRLNGWRFDTEKAKHYVQWLKQEQNRVYSYIKPYLSYEPVVQGRCNHPFRKNGSLSQNALKHVDDLPSVDGPFTKIQWKEISIRSRRKLADRLIKLGWQPSSYTDKGNPQLTLSGDPCPNLLEMDNELGPAVAHWFNCDHRKNQIQGWIDNVQDDGRIYYDVDPCGTNTRRMRHKLVVNVPKAEDDVFFGNEMRSLFIAKPPYYLVGIDAAGMENRIIAHYMLLVCGEKARSEIEPIIDPEVDFHTQFWEAISEFSSSRSHSKNIEYAVLFGAQNHKLGTMADIVPRRLKGSNPERIGEQIRSAIGDRFPSLNKVLEYVDWHVKKYGYLVGPDGGKLWPRGEHSAFNTWIQGTGQIFFKTALCFADKWIRQEELDSYLVGVFHDEMQHEVHEDSIKRHRELVEQSLVQAGKFLKLKVPMEGESTVGTTWKETH